MLKLSHCLLLSSCALGVLAFAAPAAGQTVVIDDAFAADTLPYIVPARASLVAATNAYTSREITPTGTAALSAGTYTPNARPILTTETLFFDHGGIFAGNITGHFRVTVSTVGTVIFTGTNSYFGDTEVKRGNLVLGPGYYSYVYASGSELHPSQVTLAGTGTYRDVAVGEWGTVLVGIGGSAGMFSTYYNDDGFTAYPRIPDAIAVFNEPRTYIYSGTIGGDTWLCQTGSGTVILTGNNRYTHGTTIVAGSTLQLGNASTTGSVTGDITDDGTLIFNRSDTYIYGGNILGRGSIIQQGPGRLILTAHSTFTGGTTIAPGTTLQLGNEGPGSIIGPVINYGTLVEDRLNMHRVQQGSNNVILTDSFSGSTATFAGTTLQVGNGGTSGSVGGNIADDGALIFNRSDTYTYGGVISGSGTVTQRGTGTLILTGDNTFTGGVRIDAGTLSIGRKANLGRDGTLTMAAGTTLAIKASDTFTHAVTVAGDPIFNVAPGTTTTWSGLIADGSSPGTIEITGGGTFHPTNIANSYSGGTVVRDGSTLRIDGMDDHVIGTGGLMLGDATTSGTLATTAHTITLSSGRAITLAAGGGIIDVEGAADSELRIAQAIGGTGSLTKAGPGTLTLTGSSTYTGGTTIAAGTLQVGSGEGIGSITGNVVDNGALIFNRSGTYSYGGVISGTGILTQRGPGTLILTGDSTSTGGIGITSGSTLQLGNGGATGSLTGKITDNGSLVLNRSDTYIFNADISGNGTLTQKGPGTLILTGYSGLFKGNTTIAPGSSLQVGNGATSGSVGGDITNNGTLIFDRSDTYTYGGVISGKGAITQQGRGTLVLTGRSTFTGKTTIAPGSTLQLGNGWTGGSVISPIVDNGALVFNHLVWVTYTGNISGSGTVTQQGPGTLELMGANSYAGTTFVQSDSSGSPTRLIIEGAGTYSNFEVIGHYTPSGEMPPNNRITLEIRSGTITGNIALVSTITEVEFNSSKPYVYAGVISGSGAVRQIGWSRLILTGDSTYTGGTTITSVSTLQLGNGGTSGSVVGTIRNYGKLIANRSDTFGQTVWGGSVVQAGSGTFLLSTPAGGIEGLMVRHGTAVLTAGSLVAGPTQVNAGATLKGNGAIAGQLINNGTVAPGQSIGSLRVLSFVQSSSGVLEMEVSPSGADALHVVGTAQLGGRLKLDFAPGTYAGRFRLIDAATITGQFASVDASLPGEVTGLIATPSALDLVVEPIASGQIIADVYRTSLTTASALSDALFTHTQQCTSDCPMWTVWKDGALGYGMVDANSGAEAFSVHSDRLMVGIDYHASGYWYGLSAAYVHTGLSLDDRQASARTDAFAGAITGGAEVLAGRLDADLLLLHGNVSTYRIVDDLGVRSRPRLQQFAAGLQYSQPIVVEGLEGFVRANYLDTTLKAFRERSGSGFDLAIPEQSFYQASAAFGLSFHRSYETSTGMRLIPEVRVGGETILGGLPRGPRAYLADAGSDTFAIPMATPDRIGFVGRATLAAEWAKGRAVYLGATGRVSGGERDIAFTVGGAFAL